MDGGRAKTEIMEDMRKRNHGGRTWRKEIECVYGGKVKRKIMEDGRTGKMWRKGEQGEYVKEQRAVMEEERTERI